jgi:methylated-DNA-protein-cysteine methyltransferase-like protein
MRNRPPGPRTKKKAAPKKPRAQSFSDRVYDVVRRIPPGRAASYGDVAALLGTPRAARGVGWALNALDGDSDVPWWRVINQRGAISIRHPDVSPRIQRALLEDEGVAFDDDGCVDWAVVRWIPPELAKGRRPGATRGPKRTPR